VPLHGDPMLMGEPTAVEQAIWRIVGAHGS
jgi:hypothetical protein